MIYHSVYTNYATDYWNRIDREILLKQSGVFKTDSFVIRE